MNEPLCILCGLGSHRIGRKNKHTLYTCISCGLTFVHPTPDVESVYGEDYFAGAKGGFGYVHYDADKEPMVPTFEAYLSRIKLLTDGRKILDVGAATGFFLQLAKRSGFDPYGIEISPYAADVATNKGIPMTVGTLVDVPELKRFDVITMLDVIEHVSNPIETIRAAHHVLIEGGLLIINTPDKGSLYARSLGMRWHLIVPPEHLFYFNRTNMRLMLEKNGFEVLSVSTIGKRFTLSYIFNMLYAWQGLALWRILSNFCKTGRLGHIAVPINLGDNMFVIARKKLSTI
jgi:SAM-dependent methyltransferase